jgi:hypothetical protein
MINSRCATRDLTSRESGMIIQIQNKTSTNLSILRVPVVYTVLYENAAQNIGIDYIRENHRQLNVDFRGLNTDLTKIPTQGVYAVFRNRVGDARTSFDPVEVVSTDVRRVKISGGPLASVSEALIKAPPIPKKLNIYIADLGNNTLGEAVFSLLNPYAACVVHYKTVGSLEFPAATVDADGKYIFGRTMTHEVGHCFSLTHPWQTGCTRFKYADIPRTKTSNTTAELVERPSGWIGKKGNKYNDLLLNENKSCTGNTPVPPEEYELFFQFMEYVSDLNMIMFSHEQCQSMHAWVEHTRVSGLLDVVIDEEVEVENDGEIPEPDVENISSSLNTTQLVAIIISVLVFFLFISGFAYYNKRTPPKKNSGRPDGFGIGGLGVSTERD